MVPTRPPTRCTPTTSSESSYPQRYFSPTASAQMTPAARPITSAPSGVTDPPLGVIATRPATMPEAAPRVVACPSRTRSSDEPADRPGGSRAAGGHEHHRRRVVGAEGGAGVEAVPPEPEQPGAEHHQGQVVRAHRVLAEADAGADHHGEGERAGTRADLHRHAAGEVDRADAVRQPATDVARRGRGRRPSARPGRRRARSTTETNTIHAPNRARSAIAPQTRAPVITQNRPWNIANRITGTVSHESALSATQVLEPEVLERVADQPEPEVVTERERVADHDPDDGDRGEGAEGHHHHVQHALGADHAAVEQREPRRHQQHEGGGGQQPGGVAAVDRVRSDRGQDGAGREGEGGHGSTLSKPGTARRAHPTCQT